MQHNIELTKEELLLIMRLANFFLQAPRLDARQRNDIDLTKALKNNLFHQLMKIETEVRNNAGTR